MKRTSTAREPYAPRRPRRAAAALAASAAVLAALLTPATASAAPAPAAATPLPAELETIRAAEATALYGDPAERPLDQRKSSLIALGDSQISGEGVGNYEPGTDGPTNWCHRSKDAAVHRTSIPADVTYNVSCSGANSANIRIGGSRQYADELVQSDSLAIKARNTRIKQVLVVAGANDDLQFGPVMTDCVTRYLLLQGACNPKYDPGWQGRVDGLIPKVTATLGDLKKVMGDAGYADGSYELVLMSYSSPITPDFRDNPKFPGKLPGGCVGYDADARWGRDTAVPAFQKGLRTAARQAGATYLDGSRLFQGHEVCTDNTWVRGLTVDLSNPFPPDANSVRQSFHPNGRGHAAFAACLSALHGTGLREASCADPGSTGQPVLRAGAWDDAFKPLRAGTGVCLDAKGGDTLNDTALIGWDCTGTRNQGWWQSPDTGTVHIETTHDRCLDVPGADYRAGRALVLYDCAGQPNQKFTRTGTTLRPTAAQNLCVTLTAKNTPARLQTCDGSAAQSLA
ncbi:ricin-type beta-trefoil lectin domain protein [Streptomyces albidoflavus]